MAALEKEASVPKRRRNYDPTEHESLTAVGSNRRAHRRGSFGVPGLGNQDPHTAAEADVGDLAGTAMRRLASTGSVVGAP